MTRPFLALALALLVLVTPARLTAQQAPGSLGDIPIDHLGLLVRDVAKTAKAYADVLGMPVPPVVHESSPSFPANYKGDRKAHLASATFRLNGVDFKILQPMGGASPWRERLEKHGEGLYRLGFKGVKNMAQTIALATSLGGTLVAGGAGQASAHLDLTPVLGMALELTEASGTPAWTLAAGGAPKVFGENPIAYISVIVPQMEKPLALFTQLMGVPMPKVVEPKITYPPAFTGDREGHPQLAMVTLPGIDVAYTAPVGGMTPWREHAEKHGPSLHHPGVRIAGMGDQIDYLSKKGGSLVIGGATLGYCWMDLSPSLHMFFELNGK